MMSVVKLPVFRTHYQILVVLLCAGVFCCDLEAQPQTSARSTGAPSVPGIAGPATVNLADTAEIIVPAGYNFVPTDGARTMLERAGYPAPKNLAGILVPDSGGARPPWFSIVQLSDVGYIEGADKDKLNGATLLKSLRAEVARQNQESPPSSALNVADTDWYMAPKYDATKNILEYAVKTSGNAGMSVNYSSILLGRRSVLSLTTVLPLEPTPDLTQLSQITQGLSFKAGDRYPDHQPGDHKASAGLTALITSSNGADGAPLFSKAEIITVSALGGSGMLIMGLTWLFTVRTMHRRKANYYRVDGNYDYAQNGNGGSKGNGHATGKANGNGNGNGHAVAVQAGNGKLARNGHHQRRRQFSYHAFYSDMVMNLTHCGYKGSTVSIRRRNGNEQAQPATNVQGSAGADTAAMLVTETSKLIESQQKLIEGQRKLIEAQSKLIQEKAHLLDAEKSILDTQSDLFGEQQLM
jgi:uncharacterized membrane-anchored protein